jgi:hypothetical protein
MLGDDIRTYVYQSRSLLFKRGCLPQYKVELVFLFMHALDVLLEIVKTRPHLGFALTAIGCAHVGFRLHESDFMDALPMTIEVINGCKAFSASLTT